MKVLKPLRLYTHTHTHTVYCLLVNRSNVKFEEYISKGRTMLFLSLILNNIGLSLCVFIRKYFYMHFYFDTNPILKLLCSKSTHRCETYKTFILSMDYRMAFSAQCKCEEFKVFIFRMDYHISFSAHYKCEKFKTFILILMYLFLYTFIIRAGPFHKI